MSTIRFILFFIPFSYIPFHTQAQKEATNWFFGEKAGLIFSSGTPVAVNNDYWYTYNACATQSDPKTGELMFYTNSEQVWDKTGQIMLDGTGLNGNSTITQACLIIPNPGDEHQYYILTLANLSLYNTYDNTLSYSLVDMRLSDRRGNIVLSQKNQFIDSGLSEKLTAIPHKNGHDFWIITHQWDGNIFLIYLLTASGLKKVNEIPIGSDYTFSYSNSSNIGYMQASPNGTKLACAVFKTAQNEPSSHPLDLFDFDNQSGLLSNYLNLGLLSRQYGVCFSPDNTKLYVTHQTITSDSLHIDYVRQYDLGAGHNQAIINSGMSVLVGNSSTNIPEVKIIKPTTSTNATFYAFSIQNAPNGKIYGTTFGGFCKVEDCGEEHPHRFIVINRPNAKGFECDIQLQTIDLRQGSITNAAGLPNFLQSVFNNLQPTPDSPITACPNVSISVYPNPVQTDFYVDYKGNCFLPYRLRLVSLQGKILLETTIQSPYSPAISMGNLSTGEYFIELLTNPKRVVVKIIKQ
ncbi:T9SS type A sorting domain-containing protein [Spirosoma foliorum]|uniref:T9SS type A sorting domain-containing protein n=1 Tax=Spirosoma foliorum TaxID=2710596 RepID=A0A7G5H2V1_9BACT|nr:T9SS type A sorting domain-containing protein [Spirosoma foliorum]QMW05443.1 T9SS type A sorting domain-containing protein [Spirosoma foliorum]